MPERELAGATMRRPDEVRLLPDGPLSRVAGYWLAFSPDTPPEVARRRFVERYGREPDELVRAGALLLVGPIRR